MADFNIYEELMPKIQALIAPPDNTNSKDKSGMESYQYFKKRSKRHNRDYCVACGERGNILCCQMCPAAFHLFCHDPPLNESNISTRHWICRACKYARKRKKSYSDIELMDESSNEENVEQDLQPESKKDPLTENKIIIKSESKDEENVGSELDESCDEPFFVVKTECNEELKNNDETSKVKIEPETDDCVDSADENEGHVADLNMDDVWKIIGVNKSVEVSTEKEDKKSSKEDYRSKTVSEAEAVAKLEDERNQFMKLRIDLTNYNYLSKKRKISSCYDSGDEPEKKRRGRKPKLGRKTNTLKCDDDCNGIKKAFGCMIKEALKMNAKQFTLPIEYITNIDLNIIGSEKDPESFAHDLDSSDLLKLPARKCYYCQGTCLTGQMISCDFCPAHFHLNCLNPPLCNVPDVKWMCPLHPHHVLDRVMQNPSSITELMSWWSKFSAPIDDEDVKSNFLNKVKSVERKPCQKFNRSSVKIPDIVKYHYKNPPSKIPTLREFVDSKSDYIFNTNFTSTKHSLIEKSNNYCQRFQVLETTDSETNRFENLTNSSERVSDATKKHNLRPSRKNKHVKWIEINDDNGLKNAEVASKEVNESVPKSNCDNGFSFISNGIYREDSISQPHKTSELFKPDLCWRSIENFIIRDINKNFITGGVSITTLSEDLRRILTLQNIKNYIQDLPPSLTPNTNPYPLFHPLLKDHKKDVLLNRPKRNVHAVLCPLSHRPLVYLYGRSLSIGSGFSNDVCLLDYGECNFISEEHAVIIYDKESNCYELINYSEYNSVVDGVCYTCDISKRKDKKSKNTIATDSEPVQRKPSLSTSVCKQKTGSTVMAAEARSIYKKLLQDIDKLVSKSQEEMATIAEEDLNEISKAIKTSTANRTEAVGERSKIGKKKFGRKKCLVGISNESVKDDGSASKVKVTKRGRKPKLYKGLRRTIGGENSVRQDLSLSSSIAEVVTPVGDQGYADVETKCKRRRGRPRSLKKNVPTHSQKTVVVRETDADTEVECSDDEYLFANSFYVNSKRRTCRCQQDNVKFPNGRDSSWEKSAPLNHGSYIRFGCLEFVFSIVDYPPPAEQRQYGISNMESVDPQESDSAACLLNKDDLSMKLISILNMLSSKAASKSSSSKTVFSDASSVSSPYSSRSNSPPLENGISHEIDNSGGSSKNSADEDGTPVEVWDMD